MNYFVVKPAIQGAMGNLAQVDFSIHPPIIYKAHAELYNAPESDLIFATPFFLVRDRLREHIEESGISGIEWISGEVTGSPQYEELSDDPTIPNLFFLYPVGIAEKDDIVYHTNRGFLGSEKFVSIVKKFPHRNCLFLKQARLP
jgi:hypothetical protein